MRIPLKPIRTTIIGGAAFLVPVVVILMVIRKALEFTHAMAQPFALWIPLDTVGGMAVGNLLAILMLIVICFAGGVVARRAAGRQFSEAMEAKLHAIYPRYTVIRGMTQFLRDGGEEPFKVVLARFDDNAQVAFEIERSANGLVTLFLPGAPDPWSGSVIHMSEERVTPLDTEFKAVTKNLKAIGKGLGEIFDRNKVALGEI